MSEKLETVNDKAYQLRMDYMISSNKAYSLRKEADQISEKILDNPRVAPGEETIRRLRSLSEDVGKYATEALITEEESVEHYDQNQAAYHEIAVQEARDDGVRINVSRTQ